MNINKMTKKDFLAIEEMKPTKPFTSVVIVPTGRKHDSGYGCMKFVLLNRGEVVGCVGGYSDVVHINGIGGYGIDFMRGVDEGKVEPIGWSIDLLRTSRLVRLFCDRKMIIQDREVLSDFEVFATNKRSWEADEE